MTIHLERSCVVCVMCGECRCSVREIIVVEYRIAGNFRG